MNRNKDILYQLYLQQLAQQQGQNSNSGSLTDSYRKLNNYASKADKLGNNLQNAGNYMQNNTESALAQKLGNTMSNAGGKISEGANYFKGFASRPFESLLSKTAGNIAGNMGSGALGNIAGNIAGDTAGGALGGTAAGTLGAETAGSAAAGAAGSGAAAGGSAAADAAAAGPIGALAALGSMAIQGTNRKRAKQQGEALMNNTNQAAQSGTQQAAQRLAQTQQNTSALQGQDYSQPVLNSGTMTDSTALTGAAAPVQRDNPIQDYQNYLRENGYPEDVVNGVPQGLNSGYKDISNWINQYNSGAGANNPINIPQTDEETELAKQGLFNNNTALQGRTAENIKQGLLDKFISGIGDFSRGYNENRNTGFSPENLTNNKFSETTADNGQGETKYYDKSKMGRLGEAFGTMGRVMQNPAAQALIAGGLSTALTGNPLYGLGQGYKFGSQRAMSNLYQKELANQGIDTNTGTFGNLSANDFNTLMTPQYKYAQNEIAKAQLEEKQCYHDIMAQYNADRLAETIRNNTARNNISAQKAAGKSGSSKSTQPKPQEHQDWNNDLAGFLQRYTDPNYSQQIGNLKAKFIEKYGVDPMGYLKGI